MKKSKLFKINRKFNISKYFFFLSGIVLYAIGFNLFLLPMTIVFGGLTGLSVLFSEAFKWEPATFIFIVQIFLLIGSYFLLGKEKTMKSILGSLLLPVFIKLTANIGELVYIDNTQLLLSSVFGAVLCGLGVGLVYKTEFTTGGTDILNQLLNKYFHTSMGKGLMICDGIIIAIGMSAFGFTKAMYALVIVYIMGTLADKVLLGISESKAFYIITNKDAAVRNYIIKTLNRGVTIFNVKGGFKGRDDQVLFCVVPTKEYFKLREGVLSIDKGAFFVVTDAYEVYGGE